MLAEKPTLRARLEDVCPGVEQRLEHANYQIFDWIRGIALEHPTPSDRGSVAEHRD